MSHTNDGALVWYELLTTDPEGARAFYPSVVGWTTQAWGTHDYVMWVGSQGPIGGVSKLPEAARQMGAPSYWQANIQVANLDASVAKVKELGGKLIHQEDVPMIGRLAVISDPQGAVLALYQPDLEAAPHDLTRDGEFAWHELYTSDEEAAFSFYEAIAGWERLGSFSMGPMGNYLLWGRGGKQLGGMMKTPPGMKTPDGHDVPPSWMYYVTCADLDGSLERAKSHGAKVLNGPMEVPGGQRIVQLLDPQGAAFALSTPPKKA